MFLVVRHPVAELATRLDAARRQQPTYGEVGATRQETLPVGYAHDRREMVLGHGDEDWERAKDAIRKWKAHQAARIGIVPVDASIEEGNTVLASVRAGPLLVVAPCRIVYVTDTPTRFGFAYGTLPGHPERGEEAFHVAVGDDGAVRAEIVVFSRAAELPTRVAGPVGRLVQQVATRRYLEGILEHVRADR